VDAVTILGIFCFISAAITYGLGIYVYAKNPESRVNRLFLMVTIGASYWGIGEFQIWSVNSYENVLFWLKASSFWTVVIVMCIHFILAFADHPLAKRENLKYLFIILYIPALLLACVNILTDHIFSVQYSPDFRYFYAPSIGDPVYTIATIYFLCILFWAIYIGLQARRSAGNDTFRRQSSSVSIGLLVLIGFGSQSVVILPLFGIFAPNLVFIGIVFFSIVITYAILKYGLFILSPETVATHIIQIMPDGLILTDMDGRVITTNTKAKTLLHGLYPTSQESHAGPPLPEPIFSKIRDEILNQGVLSDYEVIMDSDGHKTLSISGSLVTDPDRGPAGLILIIHDITKRKNAEKALLLANEKISLLTHLTRHDISNLIMVISGYLEILETEEDEDQKMKMLSICRDTTRKITKYLHFSRDYQSIGLHEPIWQDCEHLVMRAVEDIQNEQVHLTLNLIPADIFVDPLSVKVIYNLLENALRHAADLTRIGIYSEEQEDGSLLLIIEDDGPGVRPDDKERIFKQGYGKNTGLGLTLAREILSVTDITIHEIGIYGKGARFAIQIPPKSWRKKSLSSMGTDRDSIRDTD